MQNAKRFCILPFAFCILHLKTMSWLELSVTVDQEAAESVAELLARHGYNGGVVAETPFKPGDEGPEFEYDTARPVTLRT